MLPSTEILQKMGKFNEELVKNGVMLAGEGLQATSKGKRVKFEGEKRTVIDGPFTETKELIAGFWLWQVRSMDEAVEWLKRAPFVGARKSKSAPSLNRRTSALMPRRKFSNARPAFVHKPHANKNCKRHVEIHLRHSMS